MVHGPWSTVHGHGPRSCKRKIVLREKLAADCVAETNFQYGYQLIVLLLSSALCSSCFDLFLQISLSISHRHSLSLSHTHTHTLSSYLSSSVSCYIKLFVWKRLISQNTQQLSTDVGLRLKTHPLFSFPPLPSATEARNNKYTCSLRCEMYPN